ncbi:hypothetical protein AN1V17_12390 [Vallitalea sediminicola]
MKYSRVLNVSIVLIILSVIIIGCSNKNQVNEDQIVINNNENQKTQEKLINNLKDQIVKLEEENNKLNEQIDALDVNNDNQDKAENGDEDLIYREDRYQNIVGVKSYESDCSLMMFPYSDSEIIGTSPKEVRVISTGTNNLDEKWALVEDLGSIAWNRYGYIKIEGLSDQVEGKFDYDSIDVKMKIGDIKIGEMKEKVISLYGTDYAVIKDGNGFLITYNDEEGIGLDITLDSRLSRVMGVRTNKEGYLTQEGFGVGDNALKVCNHYKTIYKYDFSEALYFDLGDMYIMMIQFDTEELNEASKITRIDILPDWNGIFNTDNQE